jgi:hypothetical protein
VALGQALLVFTAVSVVSPLLDTRSYLDVALNQRARGETCKPDRKQCCLEYLGRSGRPGFEGQINVALRGTELTPRSITVLDKLIVAVS